MVKLICTEGYCDLHDYKINAWGVCLRSDALRRNTTANLRADIDRYLSGSAPVGNGESPDVETGLSDIRAIVKEEVRKALEQREAPRRSGGTPL